MQTYIGWPQKMLTKQQNHIEVTIEDLTVKYIMYSVKNTFYTFQIIHTEY